MVLVGDIITPASEIVSQGYENDFDEVCLYINNEVCLYINNENRSPKLL